METRAKTALRGLVLSLDAVVVLVSMIAAVLMHPWLCELMPAIKVTPAKSRWPSSARLA